MPDDIELFLTILPFAIIITAPVMIFLIFLKDDYSYPREEKIRDSIIIGGGSIFILSVYFTIFILTRR